MKFVSQALSLIVGMTTSTPVVGTSFQQDVVGRTLKTTRSNNARAKLRQRILSKAKPYTRELANYYGYNNGENNNAEEGNYYNNNNNAENNNAEEGNYNNGENNNEENNNEENNNEENNNEENNNAEEGANTAYYYNGAAYAGDLDYDNFAFDVSNYSLKYVKCQIIRTYSDNIAAYQGNGYMPNTILEREQFVVFRFCPTSSCSADSNYGCDSNYGEYILLLSDYLTAMKDYNDDRLQAYCNYCEDCTIANNSNRNLGEYYNGGENQGENNQQGQYYGNNQGENQAEGNQYYNNNNQEEYQAGGNQYYGNQGENQAEGNNYYGNQGENQAEENNYYGNQGENQAEGNNQEENQAEGNNANANYYKNNNAGNYGYNKNNGEKYGYNKNNYVDNCNGQCDDYEDKCNYYDGSTVDFSGYFNCVEFADNYGGSHYIGPKCSSNGKSIELAVFNDQYCTEINQKMSASDVIGVALSDDGMAEYYQESCISCKESELPWQQVAEDAADDDNVSEICETLYYDAAKCNKNYKNFYFSSSYGGYSAANLQMGEEDKVCYYIQNVLQGYDEYGEIYLDQGFSFGQNNDANSAQNQFAQVEVTPLQIVGILFAVLACVALTGYSCYLHRAIMKKAPWRPNRGGPAAIAGQISRQNSGIIIGRSRSTGSTHYSPGGQMS